MVWMHMEPVKAKAGTRLRRRYCGLARLTRCFCTVDQSENILRVHGVNVLTTVLTQGSLIDRRMSTVNLLKLLSAVNVSTV